MLIQPHLKHLQSLLLLKKCIVIIAKLKYKINKRKRKRIITPNSLEKITLDLILHFITDFYIRYKTGQYEVWSGNCLLHEEISMENEGKH